MLAILARKEADELRSMLTARLARHGFRLEPIRAPRLAPAGSTYQWRVVDPRNGQARFFRSLGELASRLQGGTSDRAPAPSAVPPYHPDIHCESTPPEQPDWRPTIPKNATEAEVKKLLVGHGFRMVRLPDGYAVRRETGTAIETFMSLEEVRESFNARYRRAFDRWRDAQAETTL